MNESHHRLALPQGTRIQDFEFHRVLGQGGFGITYLGWNLALNIPVAIKEYLPYGLAIRDHDMSVVPQSSQVASDFAWGLDDFLEEARRLAQFNHPNIVRVHHFFQAHGTAYIVMEYAEGETLSEFLQSRGTLNEEKLKGILYPILDGLEVVHGADFLHRDIKPGNIIIRDEDDSPVLIDFGAARQAIGVRSQSIDPIISPPYSPIEQYSGRGEQGPGTDLYALGAVCYRALIGEGPDEAPERVEVDPLIPVSGRCAGQASSEFLSAIDWALQVHKANRPRSIAEWRAALEGGGPSPPPPPPPPPEETSRLNLWFRLGTCISLLAIALLFIVLILEKIFDVTAASILTAFPIFLIIGLLCGCCILHKLWSLIPAEEAKTTPGKVVGFLFIPFFNLYWNFIAFYDLAQTLNSLTSRRALENKKVIKGLCLSFCIFFTFNLLISHLIILQICGISVLNALPSELLLFCIFFAVPTNVVLSIIMFKQMKNTGIALIGGVEQEDIEDPENKAKGKVLWSIFCLCLLLAGLGGYVWLEQKDNTFKDCAECPEMVVVPSGSFTMGSPDREEGRDDDEGPQHVVYIDYKLAVGVYEVTFSEWEACVNAGGCGGYVPPDMGWGRGNRPVIYVSWDDAQSYVRWLSAKTDHKYRLLSESEWEYVARAGTDTPFHFGSTISTDQANYNGNYTYGTGRKGLYREKTLPVGSFSANGWGVHDMHGNVWEWVKDCYNDSYVGAPKDGSAWESGSCGERVKRGGSFMRGPGILRSADRGLNFTEVQIFDTGFRVVRRF